MEDTDVYRYRVNGTYMYRCIGKPVSIIGTSISTNPNGTSVELKTLDNHVVTINMKRPLNEPLSGLVEFRGTGQTKSSIICDDYTIFPSHFNDKFDADGHNGAIALLYTVPNEWTGEK